MNGIRGRRRGGGGGNGKGGGGGREEVKEMGDKGERFWENGKGEKGEGTEKGEGEETANEGKK